MEILDIYTRNGEYLGSKEKSICHDNPDFYHKVALIWIINDNKEILIQKRAACKKSYPNKWDMGCSGHIISGETPLEGAIREIKEELGIETNKEDYKYIFEYVFDSTHEIGETFLLKINKSIDEIKIDESEVSEVKWVDIDELKDIVISDDFAPYEIDYKNIEIRLIENSLK